MLDQARQQPRFARNSPMLPVASATFERWRRRDAGELPDYFATARKSDRRTQSTVSKAASAVTIRVMPWFFMTAR